VISKSVAKVEEGKEKYEENKMNFECAYLVNGLVNSA